MLETLTLSNGDGQKTINAKVIDSAGNVATTTPATVTVDTVDPVVSLSSDSAVISNVSGYDTAILTMSGVDATSGVSNYTLTCGDTTISYGSSVPTTFNLTSANAMSEGSNTLVLTVEDAAGNSNTASVTVKLDTTAPTATIGTLNEWYRQWQSFSAQLTYGDDTQVAAIYAWVNTIANDTNVPSLAQAITPSGSPQTISYNDINGAAAQLDANYLHIKVVDTVGNSVIAHSQFGYDSIAPDKPVVSFGRDAYNTLNASISITTSDATSGLAYMQVLGDISDATPEGEWEAYASTRSVTLITGDGMKGVTVKVKDNAGNESTLSDEEECELDTTKPTGTIDLYEPNNTTAKPNVSPVAEFVARVAISDDSTGVPPFQFKIYGDFTETAQAEQGITEANAEWRGYTPDSGQNYMSITSLFCTSGDGEKEVYIKIRDNAGNENEGTIKDSFHYDTSEPVVVVSNIDYQIISKVRTLRRGASGEIAGKWADECNFTFTPNEHIQAYKVCAYADQAAAEAGDENDAAIPSAGGSVNMSATGIDSDNAVSAKIRGADFEAALGDIAEPGDNDGAHVVVVYVQDLGGTWSAAADFTVTQG